MKKNYILTCINEKGQLVFIKEFSTEEAARKEMREQFTAEQRDAEMSGYDNIEGNCVGRHANISYGDENEYSWEVSEVLNPTAEDAATEATKQEFIENAYFNAKAAIENDNIQKLTEAVGDYDSFYLDEGNETIMVWNKKARNYTSIFSLPANTAHEIAKQIDAGDYAEETI